MQPLTQVIMVKKEDVFPEGCEEEEGPLPLFLRCFVLHELILKFWHIN